MVGVAFLLFPFVLYAGKTIMVVTSDSMLPTLKPYDMIVVERTGIEQVREGDIIAFDSHIDGIGIVAHRAFEVFNDAGQVGISTKGDNVEEPDGWTVHREDFIGKVVAIQPKIGFLLSDPMRFGLVAVIVITAVSLLYEVRAKPKTV